MALFEALSHRFLQQRSELVRYFVQLMLAVLTRSKRTLSSLIQCTERAHKLRSSEFRIVPTADFTSLLLLCQLNQYDAKKLENRLFSLGFGFQVTRSYWQN